MESCSMSCTISTEPCTETNQEHKARVQQARSPSRTILKKRAVWHQQSHTTKKILGVRLQLFIHRKFTTERGWVHKGKFWKGRLSFRSNSHLPNQLWCVDACYIACCVKADHSFKCATNEPQWTENEACTNAGGISLLRWGPIENTCTVCVVTTHAWQKSIDVNGPITFQVEL